jgi:hypothetical protein
MYISYNILYVYLAGDLISTILLGKSDSTLTSWLHQQSPTTTPTSRELSATRRRLQRLLSKISACVAYYVDYSERLCSRCRHTDRLTTIS